VVIEVSSCVHLWLKARNCSQAMGLAPCSPVSMQGGKSLAVPFENSGKSLRGVRFGHMGGADTALGQLCYCVIILIKPHWR
jgi:hypothetical protein